MAAYLRVLRHISEVNPSEPPHQGAVVQFPGIPVETGYGNGPQNSHPIKASNLGSGTDWPKNILFHPVA